MMFLEKKSAITAFKAVCIVFVCVLMCVFFQTVLANEKNSFEVEKIKSEVQDLKLMKKFNNVNAELRSDFTFNSFHSFDSNTEDISLDENGEGVASCYSQYIAYYAYALILGAYINVKRLYKMGPI